MEIKIRNLSKSFGKKQALNNVSLDIEQGMFGLLGRNGAGKSTLMRILTTLISKDSGDIDVCGINITNQKMIRESIGYLPQDFSVYPSLTVYGAMDYLGVLSGVSTKDRKKIIPKLLRQVNLEDKKNIKFKALSGGMKRRLGIAQALIHNPKVLIVDEPTAGLDPEERIRFRNLLSELAKDKIVILSTHIVGDIESTCENIGILDEGNILYKGKVDNLRKKAEGKIFTIDIARNKYDEIKNKYKVISMVTEGEKLKVRVVAGECLEENAKLCEPTIEDAYMFALGGENHD